MFSFHSEIQFSSVLEFQMNSKIFLICINEFEHESYPYYECKIKMTASLGNGFIINQSVHYYSKRRRRLGSRLHFRCMEIQLSLFPEYVRLLPKKVSRKSGHNLYDRYMINRYVATIYVIRSHRSPTYFCACASHTLVSPKERG